MSPNIPVRLPHSIHWGYNLRLSGSVPKLGCFPKFFCVHSAASRNYMGAPSFGNTDVVYNFMTRKFKILLPFLLLIFTSCFNTKTPETYLIPDGYQGKITVVYEQDKGRDEEFEGDRRLYRIDTNGILITKFKSEDGTINEDYYYIKSDGARKKISIDSSMFWRDSSKIKSYLVRNYDSTLIRYFGVAGRYGGGTDFPKQIPYSQSIIGNGRFMDTTDLVDFDKKQWLLIVDKLR